MGLIWKYKMVLLSTLAALVIIAHSAEEEYEEYNNRRQLRPRVLDTGSPRIYDQPWRTMDLESVTQQTTPRDTWMANSSGEPPRRRKLGRKRKRRPEISSEEAIPLEQYGMAEDFVRPYHDVDPERKVSDLPRRRRKKQEPRPGRWESQDEEDRPLRRRGQRRKRPPSETWPAFSEFNVYRPDDVREIKEVATMHTTQLPTNDDYRHSDSQENIQLSDTDPDPFRQLLTEDLKTEFDTDVKAQQSKVNVKFSDDRKSENHTRYQIGRNDDRHRTVVDSFSGFSEEESDPVFVTNSQNDEVSVGLKDKVLEKAEKHFKPIDKVQSMGPIDPHTLKEILKKSNGSSLSEILQQHNLTLTDLLRGKEEVISVLKSDNLEASASVDESSPEVNIVVDSSTETKDRKKDKSLENSESRHVVKSITSTSNDTQDVTVTVTTELDIEQPISEKPKVEETSKLPTIRKFSTATRRKQRIRPMMNTTYKSQLSRDMIALNARKYFNNRRRNHQEWKDLAPVMKKNISTESVNKNIEFETTTVQYSLEETTIQEVDNCTKMNESENEQNNANENFDDIEVITDRQKTIIRSKPGLPTIIDNFTEKTIVQSPTTPLSASGLRRQAFNNRLKKKRLKQKNLTTETPQDDVRMSLFGIPNLVSSSEFIARTEGSKTSLDDVTILEDFITTEMPRRHESRTKTTKYSSPKSTSPHSIFVPESTEETAKIEIEEIFNDTQTSARLARILKERNMTLSELVEHRERGSSHIHLADIFHNASKEPTPPEPFLSKSLIEPISKETYPLRALLDANNHDTTAKYPTTDPVTLQTEVNIPIVMNFGNNVNENAENMGIMSLFHNITKNQTNPISKTVLKKDSQGSLYESSITVVNTTDGRNENNTIRESRVIHVINENQDDIVSWNEIFSLMRRNYENQTEAVPKAPIIGLIPAEKIKKPTLEEDADGDGVIVLEDLQHLKDFDSNIASESNENLEFNTYERAENPTTKASILDKIPTQTKSVTVATASIAGLAMVLFLLTYIGYRWQQQRKMIRKKSFSEEHVPTPVFENRKGHKNNSSSRSISPMLSSNIYTLNTLDSRNGKESPDYMWDTLRKPFQ